MHAPVVLFAYKRPDHTRRTLQALRENAGAGDTDLIAFCDGAKTPDDQEKVEETRQLIARAGGFKSVTLHCRETNFGLMQNITDGVTAVIHDHGQAIVLEDDVVTAPGFLNYMNAALMRYRDEPKVWHISGWNYPMDHDDMPDAFLWPAMNCWGWATWADRWDHYSRDPDALMERMSSRRIRDFNLGDRIDFWNQVERNATGALSSWAIFWFATIFERGGLCLNPSWSLVSNIGLDGTGENSGVGAGKTLAVNPALDFELPTTIAPDRRAMARVFDAIAAGHRRPVSYRWRLRRRRWKKYGFWA